MVKPCARAAALQPRFRLRVTRADSLATKSAFVGGDVTARSFARIMKTN